MSKYILELKNITKTFGSVKALNNVQFRLKKGEIHCLMGENGAGKSTFIKIITSVLKPDTGTIIYQGKKVNFKNPIESGNAGIAAIYQHPAAFPSLSVTENIFMNHEILTKLKTYNYKKMHEIAQKWLDSLNAKINVRAPMSSLSVAEQQMVEIAKALSRKAKVLILDEPTASLTKFECEELYKICENLKKQGVSMILITHKFEDMYRLGDTVTVFRDAAYIGTWPLKKLPESVLVKAMVGRELTTFYPERHVKIGKEVLRVKNLGQTGKFANVSFNVRKGEVVALTGLVGAGRSEVVESIYGATQYNQGKMYINGKLVKPKNVAAALRLGIGLLTEDRHRSGLMLKLPIYQNVTAINLRKFSKLRMINKKKEIKSAEALGYELNLKARDVVAPPSNLSGGNQQKVVFAKLLNRKLKVLILDEPTKGVDILAKYSIYEVINDLAAQGYAIILISSEMPEVLGMADRIVVMANGHVSKEFVNKGITQEMILAASVEKEFEPEQQQEGDKDNGKKETNKSHQRK